MLVPFGEYMPDQPAFGNQGATVAKNVYPRTARSYGPFTSLSVYSDAIDARCQGATSALDTNGETNVFAGDATKLYRLTAAGTAWENVSKAGGYTTGEDTFWNFLQYGRRIIATNYNDAIQSYVMGSSTDFANLSADAPKARYIAAIKNFVFAGNTYDATDGTVPNRVWWSAFDDPTTWPTPGSATAAEKQSDFQDIPDGGYVQGIVGALGSADGAIFMESRIVRVTYIGPPAVFQFDTVEGSRGTPAPGSIVQLGAVVYYLGEDGFYAFDGSNSVPIGAGKVDKTFFTDVDQQYMSRISSAIDPINKLVIWSYVSSASAGAPDKVMIYNWELNRWSTAEFSHEYLCRTQSFGQTLETLDTVNASLDALPFSLDSRGYTGGKLILSAFTTAHRLAYPTGSALEAVLETGEFDGGEGRRIFVSGIRPMVDGGTVTALLRTRDTPGASLTDGTSASVGDDGVIPFRSSTRYARAQVTIAAGGTWSHAIGIEPRTSPEGRR